VNPQQAYDELVQRSQEIFTIHSIESLTSWDQQVNMPPKGVTHRARMMAYLAQLGHQKSTDPRIGELLAAAEGATWPIGQAANLREWRRDYDQATRLPEALVTHRAGLITRANAIWQAARASSDFRAFAPILGEIVALCRDEADCLGWQAERYDALLDRFEPDLTTAQCDAWFAELRGAVAPLLQRIAAAARQKPLSRGNLSPQSTAGIGPGGHRGPRLRLSGRTPGCVYPSLHHRPLLARRAPDHALQRQRSLPGVDGHDP